MSEFSEAFADMVRTITSHLPSSRERSLAITKLEEAEFWLSKAVGDA